jgi:hypothetical protein
MKTDEIYVGQIKSLTGGDMVKPRKHGSFKLDMLKLDLKLSLNRFEGSGIIAAQSIGKPLTSIMLNSFHSTGKLKLINSDELYTECCELIDTLKCSWKVTIKCIKAFKINCTYIDLIIIEQCRIHLLKQINENENIIKDINAILPDIMRSEKYKKFGNDTNEMVKIYTKKIKMVNNEYDNIMIFLTS